MTPRSQGAMPIRLPLLTAKAVYIHIFYFLQSIFLGDKVK